MIFSCFLWLMLYEAVSLFGSLFDGRTDMAVKAPLLLVYDVLLIIYIIKRGYAKKIGLCKPQRGRGIVALLPFLAFPIYNAIYTFEPSLFSWHNALVMLAAVAAEEIFFRGFLQNLLLRKCGKYRILISAAAFAFCHALNFFQAGDICYIAVQIISAFAAGLAYGAVTVMHKSLLVAMALHFLTNASAVSAELNMAGVALCIIIYAVYTALYIRKADITED